jgi:hypothetical protein
LFYSIPNRRAAQLSLNRQKGKDFEKETVAHLETQLDDVVTEVTIRPSGMTDGKKVRVDVLGKNKETGEIELYEMKSSPTATYTPNQKEGYPRLAANGGEVVGKKGGEKYPNGTKVPPTTVKTIRKDADNYGTKE